MPVRKGVLQTCPKDRLDGQKEQEAPRDLKTRLPDDSVQLKSSPGCESHPDIWAGEPQPKTARPGDELLFLHPHQFPGLLY